MINGERLVRDIIVIGGSAGGVQPVITILERLPGDLPAAAGVVLHRSPFYATQLPFVLGRRSRLTVMEAEDGTPVKPGTVYIAPRDRHKKRKYSGDSQYSNGRAHQRRGSWIVLACVAS